MAKRVGPPVLVGDGQRITAAEAAERTATGRLPEFAQKHRKLQPHVGPDPTEKQAIAERTKATAEDRR